MERHIHQKTLARYRRLLAASEGDPVRNEVQHNWLLKLLADEEAEDTKPLDGRQGIATALVRDSQARSSWRRRLY
jgi:hypothetical protein